MGRANESSLNVDFAIPGATLLADDRVIVMVFDWTVVQNPACLGLEAHWSCAMRKILAILQPEPAL